MSTSGILWFQQILCNKLSQYEKVDTTAIQRRYVGTFYDVTV